MSNRKIHRISFKNHKLRWKQKHYIYLQTTSANNEPFPMCLLCPLIGPFNIISRWRSPHSRDRLNQLMYRVAQPTLLKIGVTGCTFKICFV
ncbi:unnamed protein product [Acanthoscelides obtectus]|uniref:Uncharacterized protein n=1 Tax=Acanthoscelides obtectus TaxID=200917 RepID=A0A9P0JKG4_ACAOB|nr:unnamed protein product [Acanthoscelides obtectus]CAK1678837.1 hypothetical protein AOBTE_LOCUS32039 [Acanthoscelides obtectus]